MLRNVLADDLDSYLNYIIERREKATKVLSSVLMLSCCSVRMRAAGEVLGVLFVI
jgi:hypothetical protein